MMEPMGKCCSFSLAAAALIQNCRGKFLFTAIIITFRLFLVKKQDE